MRLREINAKDLLINPFSLIEDNQFLITSAKEGTVNTMTAASGAIGHMFRKNVVYLNIRPERYTHDFVDASKVLSLSFLPRTEENKQMLRYLGTVSGRTENKLEKVPLTLAFEDGIPYFRESHTVFLCRCLFKQPYAADAFLEPAVKEYYYPKEDYHDLYICEIRKILVAADSTPRQS